jgi:hypothetical protein
MYLKQNMLEGRYNFVYSRSVEAVRPPEISRTTQPNRTVKIYIKGLARKEFA